MIDLTRETAIPLTQVPRLPWLRTLRQQFGLEDGRTGNRRLHVSTIFRWCGRGIRGNRLEYVQIAGTRVTTEAALLRFFQHLTQERNAPAAQPVGRHQHNTDHIERQLDALLGPKRPTLRPGAKTEGTTRATKQAPFVR